jgi:hypothetical protein
MENLQKIDESSKKVEDNKEIKEELEIWKISNAAEEYKYVGAVDGAVGGKHLILDFLGKKLIRRYLLKHKNK